MPQRDPHTPRVLLVDESEASRTQVGEALREAGLQVVVLGGAEAALPLWSLFRPQVVLMTTHAPGFSSVAVARRLQRLSKDAVPFVYLLDAPDPELRLHVLERGHGVDALCKPLELAGAASPGCVGCSASGRGCAAPRDPGTTRSLRSGTGSPRTGRGGR